MTEALQAMDFIQQSTRQPSPPDSDSEFKAQCPHCSVVFPVSETSVGKNEVCKQCGQPLVIVPLAEPLSASDAPENAVAIPQVQVQEALVPQTEQSFRSIDLIIPRILCMIAFIACCVWRVLATKTNPEYESEFSDIRHKWSVLVAAYCAGYIWFLISMGKSWSHVIVWARSAGFEPSITSAGRSFWLCFIPIYNLYWVARYLGIDSDLNEVIEKNSLNVPFAKDMALAVWVVHVFCNGLAVLFFLAFPGCGLLLAWALICFSEFCWILFAHDLQKSLNRAGPMLGGLATRFSPVYVWFGLVVLAGLFVVQEYLRVQAEIYGSNASVQLDRVAGGFVQESYSVDFDYMPHRNLLPIEINGKQYYVTRRTDLRGLGKGIMVTDVFGKNGTVTIVYDYDATDYLNPRKDTRGMFTRLFDVWKLMDKFDVVIFVALLVFGLSLQVIRALRQRASVASR